MYTVYVLKSERDGNLYIGCTGNLAKRVELHRKGRVLSTKNRLPVTLIHNEHFSNKYEAFRIEKLYKTAKGKRILKKKISLQTCGIV